MRKNAGAIPVNNAGGESGTGITVERISFVYLPDLGE